MINGNQKYEQASAFVATQPRNTSIERVSCKHCGRTRHDKATCHEIIGYPPGWNSRGGRGARGRGRGGRGGGRQNPGRAGCGTVAREVSYTVQHQGESQ